MVAFHSIGVENAPKLAMKTVNDLTIPKLEYAMRQMASAIMDVLMKQYGEATVQ